MSYLSLSIYVPMYICIYVPMHVCILMACVYTHIRLTVCGEQNEGSWDLANNSFMSVAEEDGGVEGLEMLFSCENY